MGRERTNQTLVGRNTGGLTNRRIFALQSSLGGDCVARSYQGRRIDDEQVLCVCHTRTTVSRRGVTSLVRSLRPR